MRKTIWFCTLMMASSVWAAGWDAGGKWTAHTLAADPAYNPLPVSFELPDYVKRSKTSLVPQWSQLAPDGSDYFQVLFGGRDPVILRASLQDVNKTAPSSEALNDHLYSSTLAIIQESKDRLRLVDANFKVKGAAKAILFEEVTTASDVSVQREALELALASLPPAEREKEIQKVLGQTGGKTKWHIAAVAGGKKLRVTVEYTKQDAEVKKKIMERFFQTLAIR